MIYWRPKAVEQSEQEQMHQWYLMIAPGQPLPVGLSWSSPVGGYSRGVTSSPLKMAPTLLLWVCMPLTCRCEACASQRHTSHGGRLTSNTSWAITLRYQMGTSSLAFNFREKWSVGAHHELLEEFCARRGRSCRYHLFFSWRILGTNYTWMSEHERRALP